MTDEIDVLRTGRAAPGELERLRAVEHQVRFLRAAYNSVAEVGPTTSTGFALTVVVEALDRILAPLETR